jgi:DNA processing protein
VLAVPSAPWNKQGIGCLLELRLGAQICTSARDVLDTLERILLYRVASAPEVASEPAPVQEELPFNNGKEATPGTQSEVERVRTAIASGSSDLDAICERSGLSAQVVQKHVLTLTLEGALAPDPAGRLRLGPPSNLVSVPKNRK